VDSNRVGPTDEQLLGTSQLGAVNFDGTSDKSYEFPYNMGHIFSLDEKLIVGDGDRRGKYLRLWQLTEDGYSEPRALCMHNCTFKMQASHVHPRITPDGKSVLYTSDESGYNQLYIVKIPDDITTLPLLKDVWSC
jgi:oligogalacturonide lyase